jgi:predicted Zn-dependent peptidase
VTLHRSKQHTERDCFAKWLEGKGGAINAATRPYSTIYYIHVPSTYADEAWSGLHSLLFEPFFSEEDLQKERDIIESEQSLQRWFPYDSEIENYVWTKWLNTEFVSKRQVFGNVEDLKEISLEMLKEFSQNYRTQNTTVMILGSYDSTSIEKSLSTIVTHTEALPVYDVPFSWFLPEYHEKSFADITNPIYFTGTFYDLPTDEERAGIHFLFEFLTKIQNGPLYNWLRNELGWAYELNYERLITPKEEAIILSIPLQDMLQVQQVRAELSSRIENALKNREILEAEYERQTGEMVFQYQSLDEIMNDALNDIERYGKPTTEGEYARHKRLCTDPDYLLRIYEKYFGPEKRKEFCATGTDN